MDSNNGTNRVTRSTSPSPLKKHRHKASTNTTSAAAAAAPTNASPSPIHEGIASGATRGSGNGNGNTSSSSSGGSSGARPCTLMRSSSQPEASIHSVSASASSNPVLMMVMGSGGNLTHTTNIDTTSSNSTIGALNIMSVSDSVRVPSVTLNSPLNSANILDPIERQSLKHLSVSAPAIKSAVIMGTSSSDTEYIFAPTSSKSRQKKFHRHFSHVPQEEKVLDYYSCALVADILLQGYLYITENYFAFYSNVFGYVTKLLIPVTEIVKITKEKTAKIIPNAVGVCTSSEKHVFASLLSRDTTYKLMHKVWNYTNDMNAKRISDSTKDPILFEDKGSGGDLSIPDESSGESGSGNDSAVEPVSYTPSPLSSPTTTVGDNKAKGIGTGSASLMTTSSSGVIVGNSSDIPTTNGSLSSSNSDSKNRLQQRTISSISSSTTSSVTATPYLRTSVQQRSTISITQAVTSVKTSPVTTATSGAKLVSPFSKEAGKQYLSTLLGINGTNRTHSLLVLATILLVILFLSAGVLLSRISRLQDKMSERHVFHDSDQFYQELLSWQTKLHSSSADEIHQYIHMNLKQIVRVRQSLEALSLLFMTNQAATGGTTSPILNGIEPSAASPTHGHADTSHNSGYS